MQRQPRQGGVKVTWKHRALLCRRGVSVPEGAGKAWAELGREEMEVAERVGQCAEASRGGLGASSVCISADGGTADGV